MFSRHCVCSTINVSEAVLVSVTALCEDFRSVVQKGFWVRLHDKHFFIQAQIKSSASASICFSVL